MKVREIPQIHNAIEVEVGPRAALIVNGNALRRVVAHVGHIGDGVVVDVAVAYVGRTVAVEIGCRVGMVGGVGSMTRPTG